PDRALYIMNSNGTGLTRLVAADDAAVSPDGTKIVYSQTQGAQADLFWIGITETTGHPLVVTADTDEIMPQWSKDGTKITFAAKSATDPTAPFDIYVRPFAGTPTPVRATANGD